MVGLRVYGATVLVILFIQQIRSQKILSDKKKCGDDHCESVMIRASANQDYAGPDCRFLSFKTGEEINVHYKLTGEREDLWQGSKGKAYGFFPKDMVSIEEVYATEEVEVPAQEIDFVCLNGGEYFFENEDSVLHKKHDDFLVMGENTATGGEATTEDSQVDVAHQELDQEAADKPTWTPSGFAGWFGMGRTQDKQDIETDANLIEEEAFLTRKMTMNEQVEPEGVEDVQTEKSAWLGDPLENLLLFGERKTEEEPQEEDGDTLMAHKNMDVETDGENLPTPTQENDQEQINKTNNGGESQSKWFNFASVLGFGAKKEVKKEEFHQSIDETNSETTSKNLSPNHESMAINAEGDKVDLSVTDRPAGDETKTTEINPDITVTIGPETGGSDDYNKHVTFSQFDQQTMSRISEKQDLKSNGDLESQDPGAIESTHVTPPWFKSVVSNILHLQKGDSFKIREKDQVEFGGIEHHIQFSDTSVKDHGSEFAEHSIEDNILANSDEQNADPNFDISSQGNKRNVLVHNIRSLLVGDGQSETELFSLKEIDGPLIYLEDATAAKDSTIQAEDNKHKKTSRTRQHLQTELDGDHTDSIEDIFSFKDKISLEEDVSLSSHQQTVEVFTQCESEEAAASEHCTFKRTLDQPYGKPHGQDESCEAAWQIPSPASILPSAELLKSAFSKYSEVCLNFVSPVGSMITEAINKVVSLLPEDLQPGPDFYGCSWEVVIFTACLGLLSVLVFTCRTIRCIKSRCYAGRECKLGDQITEILKTKSEVLEKLSLVQKQYEEVQQTLQDSGQRKLLAEISEQTALQESLQASNRELEESIAKLERDLVEEKQRGPELDNMLVELNEKIKDLEDNFKKEKSQKEEIRTTQKVFEINQERLELSIQDTREEQAHLQESIKQLSKESEGWEERFSELSESSRILSLSEGLMQEDLTNKQGQIKSLIDSLLTMKDWILEVDEQNDDDDTLSSINWDFENGEPLGDPQRQTIKKLIFAAMLNASLKSVESEKKQLYDNLSDEMKAKEQLAECITNLQNSNQSLSLEKDQLDGELEKLKQKMSVMMEVYQENERKLHRKLTVQERERVQKEAKLCKADEKMNLATNELVTVKTRVTELEEETERTVSSYQGQVTSYEKKSHDNWLTARAAERYLSDVKKETAHLRQKLTEAEYKLELLEKDPFALDVIQAISRAYADVFINHQEGSPYGLSPIGRLPESRAFLSPPTLLEGPLRISPMLPTGDRGARLPGFYPAYLGPKERGEINADRKSDHQRTLSDAGSLSPPWDREQKNVPPPGLPYPDHHFQQRRAERFYHYPAPSGRFSGPAELTRNQGKPFVDLPDGRFSPEYKSRLSTSRNGAVEVNNVPGAPSQESEVTEGPPSEYPMHPPPPMRVPLLPMDPRAPYFRRPFPMPPPPMDMYGPPGYPGLPPPHVTMRSPLPPHPQHFSAYPMHGETFFPPQQLRTPLRHDHPSEPPPPPASDSTQDKPQEQNT